MRAHVTKTRRFACAVQLTPHAVVGVAQQARCFDLISFRLARHFTFLLPAGTKARTTMLPSDWSTYAYVKLSETVFRLAVTEITAGV